MSIGTQKNFKQMMNLYKKFDDYGLSHLIYHLSKSEDDSTAFEIQTDLNYIEVKLERIGLPGLLEDMYNIYNSLKMKNKARESSEIVKALLKSLFRFGNKVWKKMIEGELKRLQT